VLRAGLAVEAEVVRLLGGLGFALLARRLESGGLWFTSQYQSFPWNDGEPGPKRVDVSVADITVGEPIDEADFQAPSAP
jgi:hypothetical protein